MTHLYIEQNGITEEVNSQIIEKLYNLASSGDLDETSDLKGRLHLNIAYRAPINYLTSHFPDLYITTNDYAIPFEDSNMLSYLLSLGIGSNGYITETQAAAATIVANSVNTTVTKFNELKYFTNITESKRGFESSESGNIRFTGWTALEEIDISNFTSIGHSAQWAWEDTFRGCTNLKTVTASNKLTQIGHSAFSGCSNLETISGLSGTITIVHESFNGCKKLKQECFDNVIFNIPSGKGYSAFQQCSLLTDLTFDGQMTEVPNDMVRLCTSLKTISGLSNVTTIGLQPFRQCPSIVSTDLDYSKITSIGNSAFREAHVGQTDLNFPNLTSLGTDVYNASNVTKVSNLGSITVITDSCFNNCGSLTQVTLPSTIATIDRYAFNTCRQMTTINIPSACTTIGERAFQECNNLDVTLDLSNITSLASYAFYNCNKTIISNFPKIAVYDINTFVGIKNSNIIIPKEVEEIRQSAFTFTTSLQSISFESNSALTTIGNQAFRMSTLQSITLPEGFKELGTGVFENCKQLVSVDMPSTITSVGLSTFQWANSLSTVICRATTPPTLGNVTTFQGTSTSLNIYVPDASVNAYKAAANWSTYSSNIKGISQLPNS